MHECRLGTENWHWKICPVALSLCQHLILLFNCEKYAEPEGYYPAPTAVSSALYMVLRLSTSLKLPSLVYYLNSFSCLSCHLRYLLFSCLVGMHTIKDRPVVVNGEIVIRPIMVVALTYDHRLLDGREAVTFLGSSLLYYRS